MLPEGCKTPTPHPTKTPKATTTPGVQHGKTPTPTPTKVPGQPVVVNTVNNTINNNVTPTGNKPVPTTLPTAGAETALLPGAATAFIGTLRRYLMAKKELGLLK
jgi:hypothetical protein